MPCRAMPCHAMQAAHVQLLRLGSAIPAGLCHAGCPVSEVLCLPGSYHMGACRCVLGPAGLELIFTGTREGHSRDR